MQIKQLFSLKTVWYLAFALFFSMVLPIIAVTLDCDEVTKIGWLLFGINSVYAVLSGLIAGKAEHTVFFLIFFPVIYMLSFRLFFESYAVYFVIPYIIFSLLAYGVTKD